MSDTMPKCQDCGLVMNKPNDKQIVHWTCYFRNSPCQAKPVVASCICGTAYCASCLPKSEEPAPKAESRQRAAAEYKAHLTFCAELLKTADPAAKCANEGTAIDMLLLLSRHHDSVVREGAVYGMEGHMSDPRIVDRLREMAEADESESVKMAAKEAVLDAPSVERVAQQQSPASPSKRRKLEGKR